MNALYIVYFAVGGNSDVKPEGSNLLVSFIGTKPVVKTSAKTIDYCDVDLS
jgi:hypothetical protein